MNVNELHQVSIHKTTYTEHLVIILLTKDTAWKMHLLLIDNYISYVNGINDYCALFNFRIQVKNISLSIKSPNSIFNKKKSQPKSFTLRLRISFSKIPIFFFFWIFVAFFFFSQKTWKRILLTAKSRLFMNRSRADRWV